MNAEEEKSENSIEIKKVDQYLVLKKKIKSFKRMN